MNRISVLGSLNMDLVLEVKDMPKEGETILSKSFKKIPGGKGANQAVAAKRMGNKVIMIGKVGKDENGCFLKAQLNNEGIDVQYVFEDEKNPTGMAMITVNEKGNNSIIVISGSNMEIKEKELLESRKVILESDIMISQFEVPEEIIKKAFEIAKESKKITILNPAPAKKIQKDLLKYTDIIIPNETEVEFLTGIKVSDLNSAKEAARKFLNVGVKFVIITLGENGAALIDKNNEKIISACKVKAIDSTAAGDSFIGALTSKIDINNLTFENLELAVTFANKVSSITVQRIGAQSSIPKLEEL